MKKLYYFGRKEKNGIPYKEFSDGSLTIHIVGAKLGKIAITSGERCTSWENLPWKDNYIFGVVLPNMEVNFDNNLGFIVVENKDDYIGEITINDNENFIDRTYLIVKQEDGYSIKI